MAYFTIESLAQQDNSELPPLENGDRLDQTTFLERYETMMEHVRADLIGGIVYMASPQKLPHGRTSKLVGRWLEEYEASTPGTESFPGVTNILGDGSVPEPDHCLLILPEAGGQTRVSRKNYLVGAPEFIVEVASTMESRDLHQKKADFEEAGVREYVVVALRSRRVFWFSLRGPHFMELKLSTDGIYRSRVFPGLWLDPQALLGSERSRLLGTLREGLATKEHSAFVKKLTLRQK